MSTALNKAEKMLVDESRRETPSTVFFFVNGVITKGSISTGHHGKMYFDNQNIETIAVLILLFICFSLQCKCPK